MASFVLRVGLRPCLAQPTAFLWSSTTGALAVSKRNVTRYLTSAQHVGTRVAVLRHTQRSLPSLLTATGIAGAALGISSLTSPSTLHCDDVPPSQDGSSLPPPPESSVNAYEQTFDTVCGGCVGVLVKISARMVAFFFVRLFAILEYLSRQCGLGAQGISIRELVLHDKRGWNQEPTDRAVDMEMDRGFLDG